MLAKAPPKFVHAIAMKTRSATKALRVEELPMAAEPLGAQSPEILNLIAEARRRRGHPPPSWCLARSCKVIKEAVRDAKDKLKVQYRRRGAVESSAGR